MTKVIELLNEEQQIINNLYESGILEDIKIEIEEEKLKTAYLSFARIYGCNFRCEYCFGKYGENYRGEEKKFSDERLEQSLNYFFYQAYPNANQYRIDFVSGGEPLLGIETIKKTIDYSKKFSKENNKKVNIWICTNGSLLNEEICMYLSDNNVAIGVSIDGSQEKHDNKRKDIFGKGTYERITNNIQKLLKNNNLEKKFKDIWGLATASNENCDFVEIIKEYKKIGIKNAQIRLVRDGSSYDVTKIRREYEKLAQFLLAKFREEDLDFFYMIINENDQFGKILKRLILNQLHIRRCYAGCNKITICPDGSIYPCDSFVGKENYKIGDIKSKENFQGKFYDIDVLNNEICSHCDIKYICGGDCYYNSLLKTGKETQPDAEFCEIQHIIIKLNIKLKYDMQQYDEELYRKLEKGLILKDGYSKRFG